MKKHLILLLFISLCINSFSQNYLPLNKIGEVISDSSNTTFYPKLIERFNNFDTTLTLNEYILIYYGYGFQENYYGYRKDPSVVYFSLFEKKKFDLILKMCDSTLKETPVCIASNFYKGQVLKEISPNTLEHKKYLERAFNLIDILLSSGDGKSIETAYKVLFLSDEKRVMYGNLDLEQYKSQSLINHYDELTVKKSKKFNQKKIYFDVWLPLNSLSRNFQKQLLLNKE